MNVRYILLSLIFVFQACVSQTESAPQGPEIVPEKPALQPIPAPPPLPPPPPPVAGSAAIVIPMAPPPLPPPQIAPEAVSSELQVDEPLSKPAQILLSQSLAQLKKKQYNLARSNAERANRMQANDVRISFQLARIAAEEGAYDDAEQWANRALELTTSAANKALIWRFIANCRTKRGDGKGAQDALRQQSSR